MKIVDNTKQFLGDDLKGTVWRGSRLKIAASWFSIYIFEAVNAELRMANQVLAELRSTSAVRANALSAATNK